MWFVCKRYHKDLLYDNNLRCMIEVIMAMPQSFIPDCTFCTDILYSSLPFAHIFLIKAQVVASTSRNKESCTFTGFSLQPISEMAIQRCLLKQVNYSDTMKIIAVFLKCWKQSPTSNRELFFQANYMCLSKNSSPCLFYHSNSLIHNYIEPIPLA